MNIKLDFRLLEVSLDINALETYYNLILNQISIQIESEKRKLNEYRKKQNLTPEDAEWNISRLNYEHKVDFLLPRFFWGSFIVHVYSVFEVSIIEISRLIKRKLNINIDINDLKSNFLERSRKYFNHIINFRFIDDDNAWEKIKILADVRHVIAHANGRIDMSNDRIKERIKLLEKNKKGISFYSDYILIERSFAWEAFMAVKFILEDLVNRYKVWDDRQIEV